MMRSTELYRSTMPSSVDPIHAAIPTSPAPLATSVTTSQPEATIILPAYNEAEALPYVLSALFTTLGDRYEIVVVDDGSTDSTAQIAAGFPCTLIRQSNQGKGAAVRTGLRAAHGRFVILMDADNTYPVAAIPELVALLERHAFVRGVRHQSAANCPLINRLGNKMFDGTLSLLYGLRGGDYLTGLYGLRRDAFQAIDLSADGFDIEAEICIKARALGFETALLPISYHERIGEKKLRPFQDGWRILRRIVSMALLYNPLATFIAPGLLIWLATLLGFVNVFSTTRTITFANGLAALLGAEAGFHFLIFGIAASLYGVECGMPLRIWARVLALRGAGVWLRATGAGLLIAGLILMLQTVGSQLLSASAAISVEAYLSAGGLLAAGSQILVATFFVSIFMKRIERRYARSGAPAAMPAQHLTRQEVLP